jgi:acetyltransferase-like isoleucine patch superfamily enzyme
VDRVPATQARRKRDDSSHDTTAAVAGAADGRVAPGVSHHDRLFADDHNFASRDVPIRCQCASVSDVAFGSKVYLGSKTTVSGGVTIGDNLVDRNGVVASLDTPANRIAVPFARFATASPDVP